MSEPDTFNKFAVAVGGGGITLLSPPRPYKILNKAEALNLAAYLVLLADPDGEEFKRVLNAVMQA